MTVAGTRWHHTAPAWKARQVVIMLMIYRGGQPRQFRGGASAADWSALTSRTKPEIINELISFGVNRQWLAGRAPATMGRPNPGPTGVYT